MRYPKVSIGMPVYNSNPAYFKTALSSILAQDFEDFELILSDNGSDDEAREMYQEASRQDRRIRYHGHPITQGSAFNFNFVISEAVGTYFMWAADDDVRAPGFVRQAVEVLDSRESVVSVGSRAAEIDKDGHRIGPVPFEDTLSPFMHRRVAAIVSSHNCHDFYGLHRRAILLKYPFTCLPLPDSLVLLGMLIEGPIERIDEEMFFYRVRPKDMSDVSVYNDCYSRVVGSEEIPFDVRFIHLSGGINLLKMMIHANVPMLTRGLCIGSLLSRLLARGWLTKEILLALNAEIKRRAGQKRYLTAATLIVPYFCLNPLMPFRRSFWRAFLRAESTK